MISLWLITSGLESFGIIADKNALNVEMQPIPSRSNDFVSIMPVKLPPAPSILTYRTKALRRQLHTIEVSLDILNS